MATGVATTTGKQTLAAHGMLILCTQVEFAIQLFFSSLHLSFRGAGSGMQLSFMTKGRHAGDMLMYGGRSVFLAEFLLLGHKCRIFSVHRQDEKTRALFSPHSLADLLLWASAGQHIHCLQACL